MMSLKTNKRVFLAHNDPRRQTASIGIYTHVRSLGDFLCATDFERQAGAAIEGVIRAERPRPRSSLSIPTAPSANTLRRSF